MKLWGRALAAEVRAKTPRWEKAGVCARTGVGGGRGRAGWWWWWDACEKGRGGLRKMSLER